MRNTIFGLGVAALAAVVLAVATPAAAGVEKTCWAHWDEEEGHYVAVWADGLGHESHELDENLGPVSSRAECAALVNEPVI